MSAPYLPSLTDEELVREIQFQSGLSALEQELLRRLDARVNASDEQELRTKLKDAEGVIRMQRDKLSQSESFMTALCAAGITDTGTLAKRLRIASAAINLFNTINH